MHKLKPFADGKPKVTEKKKRINMLKVVRKQCEKRRK